MPSRSTKSAACQRLETQLARLADLPGDAPVTAIRPLGEDATRFQVRIGRAQFGPIHGEDIGGLGLRVGSPVGRAAGEALVAALAREAARGEALRLLRTRARAKQDLIARLVKKGHQRLHAAAAVERLERVGLIDDASLARDRAARLAEAGRLGPRGAEAKLRGAGLVAPVAKDAVAGAFRGVDLVEQAAAAAERRARSMAGLDEPTRRRRLFGFLARRGYDHDTCRQAVARALGAPLDE
ncbi:MAG TPA: RecX family transcriptional regulator [Phycisphaerales bacterium]|nr:RecX family transcriptional regulator [Phycisphaerales bacterium]